MAITKQQRDESIEKVAAILKDAHVPVKDSEIENMDVADFGLSHADQEGAQIISWIDTRRIAARLIVLFPFQTEPEHWHQPVGDIPGKEETIRVVSGTLLMYTAGADTIKLGRIPKQNAAYYTCRNEHVLRENDAITFMPGEKHWFQAYRKPVICYSISTTAMDSCDPFTNPQVVRQTTITE